jgi:hypothetical protein
VAFSGPGKSAALAMQNTPEFRSSLQRFFNVAALDRELTERVMARENKREPRKSVRQSGWITLDGGFAARPCEVVDLSTTGAKISMAEAVSLGPKLRLAFSRDARTGRNCEVIWRRGTTIGVKFVT